MKLKNEFISIDEFAKMIRRPVRTVHHWAKTGKIPTVKDVVSGLTSYKLPLKGLAEWSKWKVAEMDREAKTYKRINEELVKRISE